MKNARLVVLSLLMIAGLLLAACGGGASTETAPQAENTAVSSDTDGAAPASTGDLAVDPANAAGDIIGYLYEGLVGVQDGAVVDVLAESHTVSDDGLDYIFNLRPGVSFHDGSALNAEVVIANFNRWFDAKDANRGSGAFAAWAENFGGFKGDVDADGKAKSIYDGIEKVNDLTVLVHLNTADAEFLTKLANPAFSIVSTKAFAGGDGGTGAYKFGSLSGSTATLEPFAGYWNQEAVPDKNMEVPVK